MGVRWRVIAWLFLVSVQGVGCPPVNGQEVREVVFLSGGQKRQGFLSAPAGTGPFPAVVYHHGGFGGFIGGAPRETAQALANAGFVGFAPIRTEAMVLDENLQDVLAAMEYVKTLELVDQSRIAIMGFSRGGLLSFLAATQRSDLKAVVLMAPAPGRGHLDAAISEAGRVSAPVLLLVAENDQVQADHVQIARRLKEKLESAGKEVDLILYPPYGRDGHRLFFEVGAYWKDIEGFLKKHLK